ncbi:uncharacterized protein MYCFIDRAFT_179043 [Pseudocercospora fijiensis CIRAD86]|uniref:Uncharacterized protein n=1 Tax=Pseudocercospora fijiensis (strain CIRAD86) TaxID=383855 RepID=M2YID0_PSEFD|nr:uncharacterized protein MYCFIDRAFT_179043 [Pseudocercospora fijiensis CIRAD86]EME77530.1 hypothetical protein MYCFIDRAFT_179043 [Pseudocercospora fijiensis CIRAD86]
MRIRLASSDATTCQRATRRPSSDTTTCQRHDDLPATRRPASDATTCIGLPVHGPTFSDVQGPGEKLMECNWLQFLDTDLLAVSEDKWPKRNCARDTGLIELWSSHGTQHSGDWNRAAAMRSDLEQRVAHLLKDRVNACISNASIIEVRYIFFYYS